MYKVSKLAAGSVIAATAALGGTSVALADGYAAPRVAYERPANWSGVYFGLDSGYQWSSIDVTSPGATIVFPGVVFGPTNFSSEHNNAVVGAHLGYQQQFGAVVLGVEGGWLTSFRDEDGSSGTCIRPSVAAVAPNVLECSARFNDVLTIGGRVGWAAGHWMPYATGGYANAAYDFSVRVTNPTVPFPTSTLVEEAHARLNGWYIGGGVEWAISPGWTTGIEYRHYEFEGRSVDSTFHLGGPVGVGPSAPTSLDATTDTVTARVSWRWGRPDAAPLK
jgi:outer membrane immunogenic protein